MDSTTQVTNRVSVQQVNVQVSQAKTDTVSDVGSFQNALNDLNAEAKNTVPADKTFVNNEVASNTPAVSNETSQKNTQGTQSIVLNNTQGTVQNNTQDSVLNNTQSPVANNTQSIVLNNLQSVVPDNTQNVVQDNLQNPVQNNTVQNNTVQNNTQNVLAEEQIMLQDKNLTFISMNSTEILNPAEQNQQQDVVNKNPLPLLEENQVNQAAKELSVLPQIINETKEVKTFKEEKDTKGMIKMGHITKDAELDKMDNDLKLLDESLKTVSDKNLNQSNNVAEAVFEDKADIKASLIANIDTTLSDNKDALQSLSELNSKISAISSINNVTAKTKTPLGSIKMTKEDANFFVNMVENQNNNVFQANVTVNNTTNQVTFADVKAQAAQSSAAVSQALIDKLQESMKTNKAFRVDFDNNVAVIMRVDSNGVLSANFIPGSAAVEQYLRNNIAELRQAFEDKGLEYNELSYTSKKQNQNKQQQRNQRGGQDE